MHLRILYLGIVLLGATSLVLADTLVLKSGKSYGGIVSMEENGKIAIKTSKGLREYDPKVVSMKLLKITPPTNGEDYLKDIEDKKFAESLPVFLKWEKRYKNLPTIWYQAALYGIGACYANTGKPQAAIKYLEKLTTEFPQSNFKSKAEFWLIEIQTKGSSGPESEKKMINILKDQSTSEEIRARVHAGLGEYYFNNKEYLKSLENYASVVVLYGDIDDLQEKCQAQCAKLFAQIGRTNEAVFYYKQLIEVYPKSERVEDAKKQLELLNKKKGE